MSRNNDNLLYVPVEARHGRFLVNPRDRYIGAALLEYGEYSQIELELLLRLLKQGDTVVEVGANIGAHTVALARHVGLDGRVHAFEPQPIVFQNLCANLVLNGLLRVHAHNTACGARNQTAFVPDIDYRQSGNFGAFSLRNRENEDRSDGFSVDIAPLDRFRLSRLDLFKIDVEGMEFDVLKGAVETIETHRPILYVENDRLEESERLIKFIKSFGYRLWWHCPPLFNDRNHAGKTEDKWPGVISVNMLCVHKSVEFDIDGATEIHDAAAHPMKSRNA